MEYFNSNLSALQSLQGIDDQRDAFIKSYLATIDEDTLLDNHQPRIDGDISIGDEIIIDGVPMSLTEADYVIHDIESDILHKTFDTIYHEFVCKHDGYVTLQWLKDNNNYKPELSVLEDPTITKYYLILALQNYVKVYGPIPLEIIHKKIDAIRHFECDKAQLFLEIIRNDCNVEPDNIIKDMIIAYLAIKEPRKEFIEYIRDNWDFSANDILESAILDNYISSLNLLKLKIYMKIFDIKNIVVSDDVILPVLRIYAKRSKYSKTNHVLLFLKNVCNVTEDQIRRSGALRVATIQCNINAIEQFRGTVFNLPSHELRTILDEPDIQSLILNKCEDDKEEYLNSLRKYCGVSAKKAL